MIVLITEWHQPVNRQGEPEGRRQLIVSHGVCDVTLRNVVMPQEPPEKIPGAYFDQMIGEWVYRVTPP